MKYRILFILLALIIVGIAVVFTGGLIRQRKIQRIFDKAAQEDRPVIVVFSSDGVFLMSLDSEPLKLPIKWLGFPFFTQSGNLRFIEFKWPNARFFETELPSTSTREIFLTEDYRGPWARPIEDRMYFLPTCTSADYKGYTITDIDPYSEITGEWESPPPVEWNYLPLMSEMINASPDCSVIFAVDQNCHVNHESELWRYDIPDGTWSMVLEGVYRPVEAIGPGGDIIGLFKDDSDPEWHTDWEIADGRTGEILCTIEYGTYEKPLIIGHRWICHSRDSMPQQVHCREIVLVDINDGFREYTIKIDCYPSFFTMYEP